MRWLALAMALSLLGCATTRQGRRTERDPRDVVLEAAQGLVGQSAIEVGGRAFRSDCSGFVTAAYHAIGQVLIDPSVGGISGTELLYRTAAAEGRVRGGSGLRRGDLVFFHNTWDRNRNGLRDDRFTHVGLVDTVEPDGRVVFLHFASGSVRRGALHPAHPNVATSPSSGVEWNSAVRRGRGKTLAGQLFFRSARPL